MFEIVELTDGSYAIRNTLTGNYVNNGKRILYFRSVKKANKHIDKLNHRLQKTIDRISKGQGRV